ncbi:MAG: glycosyltransferase family 4 protein [Acidobacteriota bacterium]|nr:glycosyltransferase family 4 protein [Acidobacteriota bacterium]
MRFAVDAHAIGRHLTGNEVYVRSLLQAFARVDKNSEFLTYISEKGAESYVPERFPLRHVSGNPFVRLGYQLSRSLARDRPELVHVQYTAPLFCPVPVIVTIHDVSFLEHPQYFKRGRGMQLRLTVARTVRSAARVLTVSEFSRNRIAKAYGLDPDKISVAPYAASSSFRVINREHATQHVRSHFGLSEPFVLSVGDLQPRKNHIGLIAAFTKLVRAHPALRHQLVLVGKDTWFGAQVHEAARNSGVADRIRFTGFVPDEDLLKLYNACDCFAFPSFYEGFGIPILEAMACGRAVVCSNTSAMPEVADGAGILFDPHSTEEITRAMADVLLDAELRARMERLGLQRATLFNWQKTAERTLEVYREVAERNRPARRNVKPAPAVRR